ncbi:hypothetical protein, partial [Pseudomonas sp. Xaverov 259]|uniref:hypothetical protein n=1 Tax=Pseudomonas sp. Xaverov 259 TaxID=2666086 RepID=UPI001C5B74C5
PNAGQACSPQEKLAAFKSCVDTYAAMRACQPPYSLLTHRYRGQARSHILIRAPKLLGTNKNAPDLSVRGIS